MPGQSTNCENLGFFFFFFFFFLFFVFFFFLFGFFFFFVFFFVFFLFLFFFCFFFCCCCFFCCCFFFFFFFFFFSISTQLLYIQCTHLNRLDEAILMSTLNIQFHDKIRKSPWIFVFSSYRNNCAGTKNRVRISHGKRAIGVRAIEVRLYMLTSLLYLFYNLNKNSLLPTSMLL